MLPSEVPIFPCRKECRCLYLAGLQPPRCVLWTIRKLGACAIGMSSPGHKSILKCISHIGWQSLPARVCLLHYILSYSLLAASHLAIQRLKVPASDDRGQTGPMGSPHEVIRRKSLLRGPMTDIDTRIVSQVLRTSCVKSLKPRYD